MKTLLQIMRLPAGTQARYGTAHTIWMAAALTGLGCCVGGLSLFFAATAYTKLNSMALLYSYLYNPLILFLNLLPAVLLESYVESLSAVSWAVGVLLLVNGAILFLSDKLSSGRESLDTAGPGKALLVGVVQIVAIFPGISRSGSTITGGLFAGFRREDAVRFSFLLSIPAILGANLLKLPDLFETGLGGESALPMLLGVAAALLSGIAAIRLLRYITKNKSFTPFSIYCALAGAAVIAADLLR